MALVAVAGWSSTGAAAATRRTCAQFGMVHVARGRYVVQQNEWNSTLRQCIAVTGTSWVVTQAAFDLATDGPPATYPSIYIGCHWGNCTQAAPLPIRVGGLAWARSTWRTKLVPAGAYDVAYDLWTNSAPSTSGQPDGSEIMIWLSSRGVQPAGSMTGRVRLAGAWWDVWTTRMSSWNYIAYVRERPTNSVSRLGLRAFLNDSIARGATSADWYLTAAEAGFEIWSGGQGLATDTFWFRAGGQTAI